MSSPNMCPKCCLSEHQQSFWYYDFYILVQISFCLNILVYSLLSSSKEMKKAYCS